MAGALTCEFPVTLEVSGDPASVDLDAVGVAVEEALVAQLRVCRERLTSSDDLIRPPVLPPWADPDAPENADAAQLDVSTLSMLSAYLIREGYISRVAGVIGPAWRRMSQAELTAFLARTYTEAQIRDQFLATYLERNAVKARFRTASVVSAIALGLVWAQDNLREEDWAGAAGKVGSSALSAWLFNRLLYARDPSVTALMARAPGAFGRWFQSAAKSNRYVNFLVRDLNRGLLLWQGKNVLMSGGGEGPVFPDVIYDVDMDDESTWREPEQFFLDLGWDAYYRQIPTDRWPQAKSGRMYIGKIEGSLTTGLLRTLDIAPSMLPELSARLYLVVGRWDPIGAPDDRDVTEADKVLVLTTGKRSGELIGLGGHYREVEIVPANQPALDLFGPLRSAMVPEGLLQAHPIPPRGDRPCSGRARSRTAHRRGRPAGRRGAAARRGRRRGGGAGPGPGADAGRTRGGSGCGRDDADDVGGPGVARRHGASRAAPDPGHAAATGHGRRQPRRPAGRRRRSGPERRSSAQRGRAAEAAGAHPGLGCFGRGRQGAGRGSAGRPARRRPRRPLPQPEVATVGVGRQPHRGDRVGRSGVRGHLVRRRPGTDRREAAALPGSGHRPRRRRRRLRRGRTCGRGARPRTGREGVRPSRGGHQRNGPRPERRVPGPGGGLEGRHPILAQRRDGLDVGHPARR